MGHDVFITAAEKKLIQLLIVSLVSSQNENCVILCDGIPNFFPFYLFRPLFGVSEIVFVTIILGYQLDYMWNYLKPKQTGYSCEGFFSIKSFEMGRPT